MTKRDAYHPDAQRCLLCTVQVARHHGRTRLLDGVCHSCWPRLTPTEIEMFCFLSGGALPLGRTGMWAAVIAHTSEDVAAVATFAQFQSGALARRIRVAA
jgi:hypothetical protein